MHNNTGVAKLTILSVLSGSNATRVTYPKPSGRQNDRLAQQQFDTLARLASKIRMRILQ
jgi:hypothetical protein